MLLESLREELVLLHEELPRNGLVTWTGGNVSARDPETGLVAIKPSGVRYGSLTAASMVVVDLEGRIVDGDLKPSSDTAPLRKLRWRKWCSACCTCRTRLHRTYRTHPAAHPPHARLGQKGVGVGREAAPGVRQRRAELRAEAVGNNLGEPGILTRFERGHDHPGAVPGQAGAVRDGGGHG